MLEAVEPFSRLDSLATCLLDALDAQEMFATLADDDERARDSIIRRCAGYLALKRITSVLSERVLCPYEPKIEKLDLDGVSFACERGPDRMLVRKRARASFEIGGRVLVPLCSGVRASNLGRVACSLCSLFLRSLLCRAHRA